jgi:hypothetical protein
MSISQFIERSTLSASIFTLASLGLTASPSKAANVNFLYSPKLGDVALDYASDPEYSGFAVTNDGIQNDDYPQASGYYNFSGNGIIQASPYPELQNYLRLDANALDIDGQAFEGSAITSTITVTAKEKLSFDWLFATNETSNKDFGFFLVNNEVFKLADYTNASLPGTSGGSQKNIGIFQKNTGFNNYTYTFSRAGTYTIGFGVVDVDDYITTSALEVKNATLTPVPEPVTVLGSLTALGFGVIMRRLRQKMSA